VSISDVVDIQLFPGAIFSVGMCILSWYWMGFGCKRIVIELDCLEVTPRMIQFWQKLYSNVLLEYVYCNRKNAILPIIELSNTNKTFCNSTSTFMSNISRKVLIPLGGTVFLQICSPQS
jgi:hypothetical protein